MKLKINENLLNKISRKIIYPSIIINRKEIKIINKDIGNNSNEFSSCAFSFSLDQKNNKNFFNVLNKNNFIKSYINKKFNQKTIKNYDYFFNRRNEDNIKYKLFNKATSTSDSFENSFNKNKKNYTFIKSFNDTKEQNNCLIIHKKIFYLNKLTNIKPLNVNSRRQNKTNSTIKSASNKRYQTIFTKYNIIEDKNKLKSQEQGQNFEILSSKYNTNNIIQNEETKETQIQRKLFTNEEIKKSDFQNNTSSEKYLRTDTSINSNNTVFLLPKFVHIPNKDNLKNFKKIYEPTFYCQRDRVKKKINLMMKNKNESKGKIDSITNYWLNPNNRNKKHDKNSILNKIAKNNNENEKKSKGIKYVSVDLNGLAKIPNRLIKFDKYGNQISPLKRSKNNKKSKLSQTDAFQMMQKELINRFIFIKNKLK